MTLSRPKSETSSIGTKGKYNRRRKNKSKEAAIKAEAEKQAAAETKVIKAEAEKLAAAEIKAKEAAIKAEAEKQAAAEVKAMKAESEKQAAAEIKAIEAAAAAETKAIKASAAAEKNTFIMAIIGIVGVVIGAKLNESANIALPADVLKKQVDDAAKVFAESELKFAVSMEQEHIERKEIEKAIQDMAIRHPPPHMKYAVVCGRRRVGKSESTTASLKGRRGVVMVTLDSVDVVTIGTIKEKICEQVGLGKSADHFEALNECGLQEVGQNPHSSY